MIREIIKIDEEKCIGCGLCTSACQEGALQLINGKAKLISESYCDGLGKCLPNCPVGALTIEKCEAIAFDKKNREQHLKGKTAMVKSDKTREDGKKEGTESQLGQWPCQIKLVPANATYFDNAHLLIAADCTAFAYANIHNDFMKHKITIIGCPKLDSVNYAEKLREILSLHVIKSITVLRMEKPCCGGIVNAVKEALITSGNMVPWHAVVISTDGRIIEEE